MAEVSWATHNINDEVAVGMPILPQLEIAQFDKRVIGMENENTISATETSSTELDIVSRINALHEKAEALSKLAKTNAQEAIKVAIECGRLLVEQKSKMNHGDWLPWVGKNCYFTIRTAQRYIKLFESISVLGDGETVSQESDSSNATPVSYLGNETVEPKEVENFIDSLPAKTLKDAYIATGILPPSKEPELKEEKAPESYTIEHVKYIDGFVKWYQSFKEKYPLEDMSATTVDMLLLDLSAIVRIYQELSQLKRDKFSEN